MNKRITNPKKVNIALAVEKLGKGARVSDIARTYGVSYSNLRNALCKKLGVKSLKAWRDEQRGDDIAVGGNPPTEIKSISLKVLRAVHLLQTTTWTQAEISREIPCSREYIRLVENGMRKAGMCRNAVRESQRDVKVGMIAQSHGKTYDTNNTQ